MQDWRRASGGTSVVPVRVYRLAEIWVYSDCGCRRLGVGVVTAVEVMVLLAVVIVAAYTDLKAHRIPNWLTGGGLVAALFLHWSAAGWSGLAFASVGFFSGFGLLILFYAVGGMGAGDVKLMSVVGAYAGAWGVLKIFVVTGLVGGVYALGLWARLEVSRVGLGTTIKNAVGAITTIAVTRQIGGLVNESYKSHRLCYAVCIAIAVFVVVIHQGALVQITKGSAVA